MTSLTVNFGYGLGCIQHGMAALEAVGHASKVDPPARRTELAAKREDTKTLATARTLLTLACNGVVALRAALLLCPEILLIPVGHSI